MPGLVIDGRQFQLADIIVKSWMDDPKLRLGIDDFHRRSGLASAITLHSTKGWPSHDHPIPQNVDSGFGPGSKAEGVLAYWTRHDDEHAGAHIVADSDGTFLCLADLALEAAYHASGVNDWTLGIEIYQDNRGCFYDGQLAQVVKLVTGLCDLMNIPKRIPPPYLGKPRPWIKDTRWPGVFGHRDVSSNRGFGDPGDIIFQRLKSAGFEETTDAGTF